MIDKIYHGLLWLCGFYNKEHLSDMLARTRQRLGFFWWILVSVTFAADFYFLFTSVPHWWQVALYSAVYVFLAWLTDHIINYTPREQPKRFTRKHWRTHARTLSKDSGEV
jgi:hypothetical protein